MAVVNDPLYEDEKNCLVADLVGGYPPKTGIEEGTWMYVYDVAGDEGVLVSVFKLVFGAWKKMK